MQDTSGLPTQQWLHPLLISARAGAEGDGEGAEDRGRAKLTVTI